MALRDLGARSAARGSLIPPRYDSRTEKHGETCGRALFSWARVSDPPQV
jgi:hypothetical protein